ncbi:MAG: 16S rRNA (guanine(966)-N(2))-methyltransferase RsmD [Methylococcus sp.]
MSPSGGASRNEIRIIGGEWRSRRLRFPPAEGLRPTPDRVRETLFNWLRDVIAGARCLDLFAGSGALGFEAASRGAARVVQVERSETVSAALRHNCALLMADQVHIVQDSARRYLTRPAEPFDVVFLDPPFRRDWLQPLCGMLEHRGWLAPAAMIYLECEQELRLHDLPRAWRRLREGKAGDVAYSLYQRQHRATE